MLKDKAFKNKADIYLSTVNFIFVMKSTIFSLSPNRNKFWIAFEEVLYLCKKKFQVKTSEKWEWKNILVYFWLLSLYDWINTELLMIPARITEYDTANESLHF